MNQIKFNPYKIIFMAACVLAASASLVLLYMTVFMAAIWGGYGITRKDMTTFTALMLVGILFNIVTALRYAPDASVPLILLYGVISFFTGAFLLFLVTNFILPFLSAFGVEDK